MYQRATISSLVELQPVVLYYVAAVNNDVDDVAHRLRRWELPPLTSPVYSISDAINNPTTLQPG